jgi:phosphopantothenoylcysteine decarboxylase/phosphopantothenate--cysteine ligase
MVKGKKIVLAVCGSIAAYKAAIIVRLLVKAGAEVQVLMTQEATKFIAPLTLSVLAKRPVLSGLITADEQWNNHVELGLWADVMLVAPASANTIAKMRAGFCDNIVLATYLSARCPVVVAPAMDEDMWKHPATQENITSLQSRGNQIITVREGELASGLTGFGRMAEPEDIIHPLDNFLSAGSKGVKKKLKGVKALVSAGPTQEAIDPVRFISNHSSGKMGVAIADSLAEEGADVTLLLGPVNISPENKSVKTIRFSSASELKDKMLEYFDKSNVVIMAAAVADYTPVHVADKKVKKKNEVWNLEMTKTTDILTKLGKRKKPGQVLVGFALETDNERKNALDKLKRKNLDYIVLNSLRDVGSGFGFDTNKITIFNRKGKSYSLPLQSKKNAATALVQYLLHEEHF